MKEYLHLNTKNPCYTSDFEGNTLELFTIDGTKAKNQKSPEILDLCCSRYL